MLPRKRLVWIGFVLLFAFTGGSLISVSARTSDAPVFTIPLRSNLAQLALAPDGRSLVTWEISAIQNDVVVDDVLPLRLFNLETGAETLLSGHSDYAASAAFAPDSQTLVSFHRNGDLILWDLASGTITNRIRTPLLGGGHVAYTPDGKSLVTMLFGTVTQFMVWDVDTWTITRIFGRPFDTYADFKAILDQTLGMTYLQHITFAVSPDGKSLVSATASDEVMLWDLASGEPTSLRPPSDQPGRFSIRRLVFSEDGTTLTYFDNGSSSIHIWDVGARAETGVLAVGAPTFDLSPDGQTLAWLQAGQDGAADALFVAPLASPDGAVRLAEFSPELKGRQGAVRFTPDGSRVVVGGFYASAGESAVYVVTLPA